MFNGSEIYIVVLRYIQARIQNSLIRLKIIVGMFNK